jgi:hypothetical protein
MADLSRIFFLAGAAPYLILGSAHAWHTPLTPDERKGLSARDPAVERAMTTTSPRLTDRTDIWRAWVGFNYSHSLGAVLFGAFVVLIGWDAGSFATYASRMIPLALIVAVAYLVLGIKYWFRTPIVGIGVSVVCFALAFVLR